MPNTRPTSNPGQAVRRPAACSLVFAALLATFAATAALPAAEHTVNIVGLAFQPADLQIEVGDTVTWVNDGGLHNVRSGDGSFGSGPPSTDLWVYSHTFRQGGTYAYDCEVHVGEGMTGTVTVEGVFGDGFDDGTIDNWNAANPTLQSCDCYFSSDCAGASFCNYGPGGFTVEDICNWMDVKPQGNPGTGCNIEHVGAWGGDICDGICDGGRSGSNLGHESSALVARAVRLWSRAILEPSAAGGGTPPEGAVEEIFGLGFRSAGAEISLGRHVADLLILAADPDFYDYFCHWEQHPDEPDPATWVDLSRDPCAARVAGRVTEALAAEIEERGSAAVALAELPASCPQWRTFIGERCAAGEDTLSCLQERVEGLALFLTTPRGHQEYLKRILAAPGVRLDEI